RLIRLFPHRTEGESHFTLYEDDGATFEYRDGNSAELKFTMRSDRTTIRLSTAKSGSYVLPYASMSVSLPPAETRKLIFEQPNNAPGPCLGAWQLHR
ncbi:MAG: DUF5110 domain-containing protein, partial [Acidobacteria bacterium]|nr:DUF5110 domain-containing protein [Acidobacteriota bacterium]